MPPRHHHLQPGSHPSATADRLVRFESSPKPRSPTTLQLIAAISLGCIFAPIWLPVMLLVFGFLMVMYFWMLPGALVEHRREKAKFRRVYATRLLSVTDLYRHIERGEGALIIDGACKHESNLVFWTPDRILSRGPQPPCLPPDRSGTRWATREFIDWCRARYVEPENGSAMAVDPAIFVRLLWKQIKRSRSSIELVLLSDDWVYGEEAMLGNAEAAAQKTNESAGDTSHMLP